MGVKRPKQRITKKPMAQAASAEKGSWRVKKTKKAALAVKKIEKVKKLEKTGGTREAMLVEKRLKGQEEQKSQYQLQKI